MEEAPDKLVTGVIMAELKLSMSTSTVIDQNRQFVTKRPVLEIGSDLSIGELAGVLQWMMTNGIPSASPIRVERRRGKYYLSSEHTTSDKMPTINLDGLVP